MVIYAWFASHRYRYLGSKGLNASRRLPGVLSLLFKSFKDISWHTDSSQANRDTQNNVLPITRPRLDPLRSSTGHSKTGSSSRYPSMPMRTQTGGSERIHSPMPFRTHPSALVPILRRLAPKYLEAAHHAQVRHMQFSPDGKYLATARFLFHKHPSQHF